MREQLTEGSICPIELTIGEWNALLNVLMDAGPYRIVNPLVQKIGNGVRQFAEAANAMPQTTMIPDPRNAATDKPQPNGVAHD